MWPSHGRVRKTSVPVTPLGKGRPFSWRKQGMLRKMSFVFLVLSPVITLAVEFVPPCTLPFDAIKHKHPFDTRCGINGTGTDPAKLLQNKVKNNFCATGTATPISFQRITDLQHRVEAPPPSGLGPNYV